MKLTTRSALIALALATPLIAQEGAIDPHAKSETAAAVETADAEGAEQPKEQQPPKAPEKSPEEAALEAVRKEQESLSLENKLAAERLQKETAEIRAEITRLKMERELIGEKFALEAAKRREALKQELQKLEEEKEALATEGELAKTRAEKLANELKVIQTQSALEITRLQGEVSRIEAEERRAKFNDAEPVYLETPLREDGTLVISDRRIPLEGPITSATADFVTDRIDYWNNKDKKLPIFIVINYSPGGSVMAGYRILKSMESSSAPVHVVVKSFAASMAACITTLAVESYCYPNAIILHHQISSTPRGTLNLTQQREFYQDSEIWWQRLATPVAQKMGLTLDELIAQMYAKDSSGDWTAFGDEALRLKWVNHVVNGMEETSINKDPDILASGSGRPVAVMTEELDAEGRPIAYLPRLSPKDVYFIYNPDNYYRTR